MKIYLDSIGCRLNQSEIETIARHFVLSGHEITPDPTQADVTVINTCSVTAAAASDSRGKIRGAQRAGCPTILVTGCWSNIEPQAAENLQGVHDVIRNADKEYLVRDFLSLTPEVFDSILADEQPRQALPGRQQRTRAFIKAQDGCDNHCTFCVTRIARGEPRSTAQAQVLRDIRIAENAAVNEVVLTGVHLASWGQDLDPPRHLFDLVQTVLAKTSVPRVRLSSLEPWDLTPQFFTLFENDRLCPHLHLPLQSGSDSVLRRMARRITTEEFAGLVAEVRRVVPNIAITTDIIVGFPGETEEEFQESLAFVSAMGFAEGHVFSFSPRKGTPAANFKPQLPNDVKKQRNAAMRAALADSAQTYRLPFLHHPLEVLWESAKPAGQDWCLSGLTRNYLRVEAVSPENRWNQLDRVILRNLHGDTFTGEIAAAA
jgi:threonylcarbamoyladenosine tRNA methylthiotransferase MtaB